VSIVTERLNSGKLSDEEIEARLESAQLRRATKRGSDGEVEVMQVGGVGVLPIQGPIFPKANLMTELSGATSMEGVKADLNAMLEDDRIHSIVMDVDSPGGMADLVQETADYIREAGREKPIYAISNTMMVGFTGQGTLCNS
jgi:capsid assembly protease